MNSRFRDRDRVIAYFEKNQQLHYGRLAEDEFVSIVKQLLKKINQ